MKDNKIPGYKVLVVDDSALHRRIIRDILNKYPLFKVVGEAENGKAAIREVIRKSPDFITLDLEMPDMDGFTFLRWLMYAKPTRTIVVTSRSSNRDVFRALDMGAVDFVVKSQKQNLIQIPELENKLLRKLSAAMNVDLEKVALRLESRRRRGGFREAELNTWRSTYRLIVIASSTGGPPAVQTILKSLPEDYPVPVIVNQHMPAGFTSLFARRLAGLVKLKVKEAEEDDILSAGVFIAPGARHTILEQNGSSIRLRILASKSDERYIPSADRLLLSAAEILGGQCIGVILTGMGEDGIVGLSALVKAGGLVIAEDESTCVVYGMPKAVIDRGLADQVLPLQEIPRALIKAGAAGKH